MGRKLLHVLGEAAPGYLTVDDFARGVEIELHFDALEANAATYQHLADMINLTVAFIFRARGRCSS